jgi:hypothetical protein
VGKSGNGRVGWRRSGPSSSCKQLWDQLFDVSSAFLFFLDHFVSFRMGFGEYPKAWFLLLFARHIPYICRMNIDASLEV